MNLPTLMFLNCRLETWGFSFTTGIERRSQQKAPDGDISEFVNVIAVNVHLPRYYMYRTSVLWIGAVSDRKGCDEKLCSS